MIKDLPLVRFLGEVSFLLAEDKRKLPILVSLFLVSSGLEVIGLALVVPYVEAFVSDQPTVSTILGISIDQLADNSLGLTATSIMGGGLVILFGVKGLFGISINRYIFRFSLHQTVRIRSQLMTAYQEIPYEKYIRRNSAEYIQAMIGYATQFTSCVQGGLQIIGELIIATAIFAALWVKSGTLLLILIALLGLAIWGFDAFFKKKMTHAGRVANLSNAKAIRSLSEGTTGLKEIRVLGQESFFHQRVLLNSQIWARNSAVAQLISTAPRFLLQWALVTFIVIAMAGQQLIGLPQDLILPTLSMFALAGIRLTPSATVIATNFGKIRYQRFAIQRLAEDLRDHSNGTQAHTIKQEIEPTVSSDVADFKELRLRQVSYHYPGKKRYSIDNVTLEIKAGDAVGIKGESGSGKSTLLDCLLGLLHPEKGEIEFNECKLNENLAVWHTMVAYLPQELFLFDGTIEENILLGVDKGKTSSTLKKMEDAIKQSRLQDVLSDLPDGIATEVGEHGVMLSGGQRQRVALARALFFDRQVIILDEATSALDEETESEIADEIRSLRGRKTVIIVSHREPILAHCNKVFTISEGRVSQVKSWKMA